MQTDKFDVEVQRNTKGSHIRRPRFHQSMMDSRLLKKNQDFKELKDTYVISICQHDKFKENKPIYHVDKIIRETGKTFDCWSIGNYLGCGNENV